MGRVDPTKVKPSKDVLDRMYAEQNRKVEAIKVLQNFESHGECVIVNYILTKVNANLDEIDGILKDHLGSIKDERHNSAILQSRKESLEYKNSLTGFKEKRIKYEKELSELNEKIKKYEKEIERTR